MSLSVTIITKNEEIDLPRAIRSVSFADEVVVVDSFSSDRTVEVAKSLGAIVTQLPWEGYGPQKNVALARATGTWVLSLDADEWLPVPTACFIRDFLAQDELGAVAVSFRRVSFFEGRMIRWGDWRRDRVVRLFRRDAGRFSDDAIHERLVVEGAIFSSSHTLCHEPFGSLGELKRKMIEYNQLGARRLAADGRGSYLGALGHGFFTFLRGFVLRLGFLDGLNGLLIAWFNAKGSFLKHWWAASLRSKKDIVDQRDE